MGRRRDAGITTVELAAAAAVSVVVLTGLATTMISVFKTSSFGQAQSSSLDGARLVLTQVSRDLQGSRQFETCTPAGSCVIVKVQPPGGGERTVRYRLVGAELYRDLDDGSGTFPVSRLLTNRLANLTKTPAESLFTCSTSGSLLRINVKMIVQPNPARSPTYTLQTVLRPRNTYQPPAC